MSAACENLLWAAALLLVLGVVERLNALGTLRGDPGAASERAACERVLDPAPRSAPPDPGPGGAHAAAAAAALPRTVAAR